jgi:hypothetical protein
VDLGEDNEKIVATINLIFRHPCHSPSSRRMISGNTLLIQVLFRELRVFLPEVACPSRALGHCRKASAWLCSWNDFPNMVQPCSDFSRTAMPSGPCAATMRMVWLLSNAGRGQPPRKLPPCAVCMRYSFRNWNRRSGSISNLKQPPTVIHEA